MKITINNKLILTEIPENLSGEIQDKLTFLNPKWIENEKRGYWNGDTPKMLCFYELIDHGLALPRGFIRQLINQCRRLGVDFELIDNRRALPDIGLNFTGRLKPFQTAATDEMSARDFGTLSAPTGSGKTVIALYMIAQRKQPALIVVHTKELLNQWNERIETFLGVPREEIGVIGSGKKLIGNKITVSLVQTLYKCCDEVAPFIGHLIVDECHRTPARTFTEAVSAFDCRYMLGLSATPWRRDRLSKLIFWHLGDVHHQVDKSELIEDGHILEADVTFRETTFKPRSDPSTEYSKMLSELTEDTQRNAVIAADVAKEAKNGGGVCLVLSDRKTHCGALQAVLLNDFGVSSELLTGDVPTKQRQRVVNRLNGGQIKVLIATGQLIGEGFDCKGLSTLFLATPIKFNGRVLQYVGRVLRPAPGKSRAKVYDYIDVHVGPLVAAAKSRARAYDT